MGANPAFASRGGRIRRGDSDGPLSPIRKLPGGSSRIPKRFNLKSATGDGGANRKFGISGQPNAPIHEITLRKALEFRGFLWRLEIAKLPRLRG